MGLYSLQIFETAAESCRDELRHYLKLSSESHPIQ